jgi:hypothetical protein
MRSKLAIPSSPHATASPREALGQIIAGPAVELHPRAILAGDHAETVVLDLVQPRLAEGGRGAEVGRHGAMKPAGRALEGKDMAGRR